MVQEIAQDKEARPVIQPPYPINSKAKGYESIAKVLGNIAERAIVKSGDYASEASKTNLLQTKSMLDDVSAKSKLEMARSPEHSEAIAKNAEQTAEKIKSTAKLNRQDKVNLELASHDIVRDLSFKAQEKSIQMTNEAAKYSTLSAFGSTLKDISNTLYSNPEEAERTIEAQYQSLAGQVRSGILTAVEAANLHKQLEHEVDRAALILEGYRNENLTASDVNALHAASPNPQPFSNANLPMTHDTMVQADSHLGHLTSQDIKSRWAQGDYVAPIQLAGVKKTETLQSLLVYKAGAAQASGDIFSGVSWKMLNKRLDILKKTDRLSTEQQGYKDRLNNYIVGITDNNKYSDYISQTPAGAKAYLEFNDANAVVNNHAYFGDEADVSRQRSQAHIDNLNGLVSKLNAVGVGADVPDQYRTAIPHQYVQPILDGFSPGADPAQAINNIAIFTPENRAILANSTTDPRKALTIYETGQLIGKADQGFLSDLWHSQQDAINDSGKETNKALKSKFLETNKDGKNVGYIRDQVNSKLGNINQYLGAQANSREILEGSTDKAIRYINYMAEKHVDPKYDHLDDYIKTYKENMERAYKVESSSNFIFDANVIPLAKPQMSLLANHAIHEVHDKLLQYMNESQVNDYMSKNQLRVVNSTQGRIAVVNGAGQLIPDKDGHPAFYEMYNEGILRAAEHDKRIDEAKQAKSYWHQVLSFQYNKGFL